MHLCVFASVNLSVESTVGLCKLKYLLYMLQVEIISTSSQVSSGFHDECTRVTYNSFRLDADWLLSW